MLKKYDATLIFPNSLRDENLTKAIDRVKEEISKLGGEIPETKVVGRRQFARPMKKRESGQYVRMQLGLDPTSIAALLARFKLNNDIFRAQIVCASEKVRPVEEKEVKETDGES